MNETRAADASIEALHPGAAQLLANVDLHGKLAVITGGSGGIGLATAAALARAGADIIIAARPGAKLDQALATLRARAAGPVLGISVDLSDLTAVDRCAAAVLDLERPIDMLINNAGVIGPKTLSAAGIETGFMTNVVGHAVLSSGLAPRLAAGGRIACLSSFGHHFSPVVFDDINFEHRPYTAWSSYGQSKTGCCLLAVKLSSALASRGIDAFSLHPGAISTDMTRDMVPADFEEMRGKSGALEPTDYLTPDQGAATTIWALTEPSLAGRGGLYLQRCAVAEIIDQPNYRTGVMRYAIDPDAAERLWASIEAMTGRTLPL